MAFEFHYHHQTSPDPLWVEDEKALHCHCCAAVFTFSVRRHHCRTCGNVICSECSLGREQLRGDGEDLRVCVACVSELRVVRSGYKPQEIIQQMNDCLSKYHRHMAAVRRLYVARRTLLQQMSRSKRSSPLAADSSEDDSLSSPKTVDTTGIRKRSMTISLSKSTSELMHRRKSKKAKSRAKAKAFAQSDMDEDSANESLPMSPTPEKLKPKVKSDRRQFRGSLLTAMKLTGDRPLAEEKSETVEVCVFEGQSEVLSLTGIDSRLSALMASASLQIVLTPAKRNVTTSRWSRRLLLLTSDCHLVLSSPIDASLSLHTLLSCCRAKAKGKKKDDEEEKELVKKKKKKDFSAKTKMKKSKVPLPKSKLKSKPKPPLPKARMDLMESKLADTSISEDGVDLSSMSLDSFVNSCVASIDDASMVAVTAAATRQLEVSRKRICIHYFGSLTHFRKSLPMQVPRSFGRLIHECKARKLYPLAMNQLQFEPRTAVASESAYASPMASATASVRPKSAIGSMPKKTKTEIVGDRDADELPIGSTLLSLLPLLVTCPFSSSSSKLATGSGVHGHLPRPVASSHYSPRRPSRSRPPAPPRSSGAHTKRDSAPLALWGAPVGRGLATGRTAAAGRHRKAAATRRKEEVKKKALLVETGRSRGHEVAAIRQKEEEEENEEEGVVSSSKSRSRGRREVVAVTRSRRREAMDGTSSISPPPRRGQLTKAKTTTALLRTKTKTKKCADFGCIPQGAVSTMLVHVTPASDEEEEGDEVVNDLSSPMASESMAERIDKWKKVTTPPMPRKALASGRKTWTVQSPKTAFALAVSESVVERHRGAGYKRHSAPPRPSVERRSGTPVKPPPRRPQPISALPSGSGTEVLRPTSSVPHIHSATYSGRLRSLFSSVASTVVSSVTPTVASSSEGPFIGWGVAAGSGQTPPAAEDAYGDNLLAMFKAADWSLVSESLFDATTGKKPIFAPCEYLAEVLTSRKSLLETRAMEWVLRLHHCVERMDVNVRWDIPEHRRKLEKVWRCFGSGLVDDCELMAAVCSGPHEMWKEVGFQGCDPCTDFRAMGVYALDCLEYFADNYADFALLLFSKPRSDDNYYPVSASLINLVHLVSELLNVRSVAKLPFESQTPLFQLLCADDSCEEGTVLKEVFCTIGRVFDTVWRGTRSIYWDFGKLYACFKERFEYFLVTKAPAKVSTLLNMLESDPLLFEYKSTCDLALLDLTTSNMNIIVNDYSTKEEEEVADDAQI